jgi:hypothetical protein
MRSRTVITSEAASRPYGTRDGQEFTIPPGLLTAVLSGLTEPPLRRPHLA